jgi:hypothetical protein
MIVKGNLILADLIMFHFAEALIRTGWQTMRVARDNNL